MRLVFIRSCFELIIIYEDLYFQQLKFHELRYLAKAGICVCIYQSAPFHRLEKARPGKTVYRQPPTQSLTTVQGGSLEHRLGVKQTWVKSSSTPY